MSSCKAHRQEHYQNCACTKLSPNVPLFQYCPSPHALHTHTHTHTYSDPTQVGFGPIEKAEWCPSVKSIDNRVHIRGMIPGSSHLQYILKALNTIIRIIYLTLNIKDMHAWCMAMATRSSRDTPTWHPLCATHVLQGPRTDQSAKTDPSTNQSHRDSKIVTQIVREDLPDIEVEGGNRLQFSGTNSIPIWVSWSWFSVGTCWFVLLFKCWRKFNSFVK